MTDTVSRPRGIFYRHGRTMPDGRLLLRSGQSFLIMQPDEAKRFDRWLIISVSIDLICIVALVVAFLLSEQGTISEDQMFTVLYAAVGVVILSTVTIGPYLAVSLIRRTQPAANRDQLEDTWNQAA